MGSKEEISDTDSGIILQSSPDSLMSNVKDVATHTRAVKLKQQSLQDRLELCLLELKKLCIRETELTGQLSSDYPLLPGEKPPRIRRRIGAAFKLDEDSLRPGGEDSELRALEADLALQTQIFEAARRLSMEEHLSKQVRRSRLQQCKIQEQKMKEIQEAVFRLRLQQGRNSPRPVSLPAKKDLTTSDDSSLSDAAVQDEEEHSDGLSHLMLDPSAQKGPLEPTQDSRRLAPPQTLEGVTPNHIALANERAPIQNSPWKESSLDQPYERPKKANSRSSSQSCSPVVTPVSTPVDPRLGDAAVHFQRTLVKNLAFRHAQSSSAPSTPDLHVRRQHSLRIPNCAVYHEPDLGRERALLLHKRLNDFAAPISEYVPQRPNLANMLYQSGSEDSGSEYSVSSFSSLPCQERLEEEPKLSQLQHVQHYGSAHNGPLAFTGPNFYKVPRYESTPYYYRAFTEEEMAYPIEMDMGQLHRGPPPPPGPPSRYEYWYDGDPRQWLMRPHAPHTRVARAPSLREYPVHHSSRGLSRELVSDELRSWHQRNQYRSPRPRSLDRQGAVRVRTPPSQQSPLSQSQRLPKQVSQRRVFQRASDGTLVQWFEEEDSEVISQV
ncbi:hypothetical protein GN956_G20038 [Arapaima gigas]